MQASSSRSDDIPAHSDSLLTHPAHLSGRALVDQIDGWLDWHHPYDGKMLRQLQAALGPCAHVDVSAPRDLVSGLPDPHRRVITTDTGDAADVMAGVAGAKPLGVTIEHAFSRTPVRSPVACDRAQNVSVLIESAAEAEEQKARACDDKRTPRRAVDSLNKAHHYAAELARAELRAVIADGLKARAGFYIVGWLVLSDKQLIDVRRYLALESIEQQLSAAIGDTGLAWSPLATGICDGCGLVFTRARSANLCSTCSCRPREPGTAAWRTPLTIGRLRTTIEKGEGVRVSGPLQFSGTRMTSGWKQQTARQCPQCGTAFVGNSDRTACSVACRRKLARAARVTKAKAFAAAELGDESVAAAST